jgi:hypothetical protein
MIRMFVVALALAMSSPGWTTVTRQVTAAGCVAHCLSSAIAAAVFPCAVLLPVLSL